MQRITEMEVELREVGLAVADHDISYDCEPKYYPCRTAIKGRVAVVYNPDNDTIVTVLWHGQVFTRPEHVAV